MSLAAGQLLTAGVVVVPAQSSLRLQDRTVLRRNVTKKPSAIRDSQRVLPPVTRLIRRALIGRCHTTRGTETIHAYTRPKPN